MELRDNRYDQVVHMVTAASGAESFYQLDNNSARSEDLDQARERDTKAAEVGTVSQPSGNKILCVLIAVVDVHAVNLK